MKTKVIGFNESQATAGMHRIESDSKFINRILADCYAKNISKVKQLEEVQTLLERPKEAIYKQLTGGKDLTLNGVNINVEKAYELLEKPQDFDSLINLIQDEKSKKREGISFEFLTVKDGFVCFDESERKRFEKRYEIELAGNHLEAYEALNKAVEQMNTVIAKHRLNCKDVAACIEPVSGLPALGDPLKVNHEKIRRLGNL